MSVTIYNRDGAPVRRSQNLRGIITHAARVGVQSIKLHLSAFSHEPVYTVNFCNGDYTIGTFADPKVMLDWFLSRGRRWAVDQIVIEAPLSSMPRITKGYDCACDAKGNATLVPKCRLGVIGRAIEPIA